MPDLAAKLPGRGVWVGASRETLVAAYEKQIFRRGFTDNGARPAQVSAQAFVEAIVYLQRERCAHYLGQACRSGQLIIGFDRVQEALTKPDRLQAVLIAPEAGRVGEEKLRQRARTVGVDVMDAMSMSALSAAIGRDHVAYTGISKPARPPDVGAPLVRELHRLMRLSPTVESLTE